MDIQLNISVSDKTLSKQSKNVGDKTGYNFVTKPMLSGKIVAKRKRQHDRSLSFGEPQKNIEKSKKIKSKSEDYQSFSHEKETQDLGVRLKDLAENKGNYKDKNYQSLSDDIKIKQKPRKGGWVSSLFKNNPEVPKMGQRAVRPIIEKVFSGKDFSDLEIHPHSIANIHQNLGLKELTTVQQMATPIILQGRDVLVRSQTGSGKTLAYALPIIEALQAIRPKIDRHDGIRVVVVVPTRELAVQTFELFVKLNRPFTWVVPGLLSGGQKRKAEKARLRKGLSILIGTPGRICDHLRHTQSLNFSKIRCLVLDEADRLLDMGYEKDVAEIVKAIEQHQVNSTYNPMEMMKNAVKKFDDSDDEKQQASEKIEECGNKRHKITDILLSSSRQTVLLSATLTKAVENLAGITMVDPVFVDASEGKAPLVADSLKTKTEVEAEEIKLKVEKTIKEENVVKAEPSDGKVNSRSGKQDTRKGLKQFAGCTFQHLFNETIDKTNKPNTCIEQESDSDSDYEYFKVQKQTQTNVVVKSESSDEDEKEIEQEDSFQTALKTAVEEDKIILPSSVNQNYIITPMKLRLVTLCASVIEHCIINKNSGKMIVFMATQDMVDYHCDLLEAVLTDTGVQKLKKMKVVEGMKKKEIKLAESENEKQEKSDEDEELPFEIEELLPGEPELDGLVPVSLEMFKLFGSMPHEDRIDVFKRFRKAKAGVLFCTDVAARGLDLPKVDMVFQYCVPSSVTDYVHRVGRTGRAANIGAAILLLQPGEVEFIRHLEERRVRLTQVNDRECLESVRSIVPTAKTSARAAVCLQARIEYVVNTNKEWLKRASRAYTSWIRFYAAYPRAIRPYLDSTSLHLGHAAKSFGLRDTPGAVAKRVRNDTEGTRVKPKNRLTVDKEFDKQRTGFPKMKIGGKRTFNKQSSMHTASEFDSGLETVVKKKKSTKK